MRDNIELFRLVIERGFNSGDLSVADEVCASRFFEHQYLVPTNLSGPETLKIEIQSARREVGGQDSRVAKANVAVSGCFFNAEGKLAVLRLSKQPLTTVNKGSQPAVHAEGGKRD